MDVRLTPRKAYGGYTKSNYGAQGGEDGGGFLGGSQQQSSQGGGGKVRLSRIPPSPQSENGNF